jgi:hypothetical protein
VASGVTLNLPGITIGRIHIKVSIHFSFVPNTYTANSGIFVSSWVDNISQVPLNMVVEPYDQKFLIWEELYAAEQELLSDPGTTGTVVAYHEFDVRAKRKLTNQNDTLWLQFSAVGNANILDYSFTQSTLLLLP